MALAATLIYNTPDLAHDMKMQIPEICIFDNGSDLIPANTYYILGKNTFTVGWNKAMRALETDYVWMLNSDVTGVSSEMMHELVRVALEGDYAIVTPAFNSPHQIFHQVGDLRVRETRWVDWTCPLVNRRDFLEIGGFDENLSGYFADADICARIRNAGGRMAIVDYLYVNHIGSVTAMRNRHVWDASDEYIRRKWNVPSWYGIL